MEKIKQLTVKEFRSYNHNKDQKKTFKKLVGLPENADYGLGDSASTIESAELLDIYKNVWKGQTTYYLVVNVLGPGMVFAHTLYQINKE